MLPTTVPSGQRTIFRAKSRAEYHNVVRNRSGKFGSLCTTLPASLFLLFQILSPLTAQVTYTLDYDTTVSEDTAGGGLADAHGIQRAVIPWDERGAADAAV